jgi:hypothetical protein
MPQQNIRQIKLATSGLGIILVIFGHLSGFWPLYTGDTASFALPYLFHMPLFFFLAVTCPQSPYQSKFQKSGVGKIN